MPEFRFRRKKKKQQTTARRHTVHDAEEAHAQVAAAREMVNREEADPANTRTRSPSISDPNDIPELTTMAMITRGGHVVSTGTLAREREKFFDLLRSKYPEHGRGIEEFLSSGEKVSKRERQSRSQSADLETMLSIHTSWEEDLEDDERGEGGGGEGGENERRDGGEVEREDRGRRRESLSSSDAKDPSSEPEMMHHHYSGCFFLRHGTELRRCPIPSPVTQSTLKNLFVNTFDLQTSLLDDPMCYVMIQDRGSMRWKPLTNISDIYDHCILQLADPDSLATNPALIPEDHAHSSSESPTFISTNHLVTSSHTAHRHYNHTSPLYSSPASGTNVVNYNGSLWQSGNTAAVPISPPHHPPTITPHQSHHPTRHTAQYGSPHSITSSTSGVCSESLQMSFSSQSITRHVRVIQRHVQELRQNYETYRKEQLEDIADFSLSLRGTTYKIMAAIRGQSRLAVLEQGVAVEPFRRQRLQLTADKEAYHKCANETMLEVSILETAVEDIRRDVVERRCRVHEREVDGLSTAVQSTLKAVTQTKEQYFPLETKIRRVMEQELTNIVKEERFLADECPRLEEAEEKCTKLIASLETLNQVAAVQFHRTPLVPYFRPVANPDRDALMENIKAVTPNHAHRVESIEMAQCVQHKKKELVMKSEGIRHFESQLRVQKDHLHKMEESVAQLDTRREKKMIALYMEEKAQREAELAKEMKWEQKVAEKKRREERERVKERLLQKEDEKKKRKKRVEQLRGRAEGDWSSQSSGEWYCGDLEGDSLLFSSSFSSTASLLEHVRSLSGWSSDTTQQDKNEKVEEQPVSRKQVHQLKQTKNAPPQTNERKDHTRVQSERHSSGEKSAKSTRTVKEQSQFKPQGVTDAGGDSLQAPKVKPLKPPKKGKQQQGSRLPQPSATTSQKHQQKMKSRHKGNSKYDPAQQKTVEHSELNNTQARTKDSAPQTPLNAIFKANQTGLQPQKDTNQTSHVHTQKNAQTAKQPAVQPVRKLQRHRVKLNDIEAAPRPARRVASSETLLEDNSQYSHTVSNNKPILTATTLVDTPPKIRKSIGYIGEFDDQAGIYDVLEKKPQPLHKQEHIHSRRQQKSVQVPKKRPESELGMLLSPVHIDPISASQPDTFDFMSNPSYETRAVGKHNQLTADRGQTGLNKSNHIIMNQSHPSHQQGPHLHQSNPKSTKAAVVHQSYMHNVRNSKPMIMKPPRTQNIQSGFHSGNPVWQQSESDSSETGHVRSTLSDHSSTRHSTVSAQQSNNSGLASGGHSALLNGNPVRSQKTDPRSIPPPPQMHSRNVRVHGDFPPRNHSGLPVPRKQHNSHAHNQAENASGRGGHRRVAPHPPPHNRQTTTHDEDTLTAYPRFQRRDDHRARLQGTSSQQRTKQLGILPGTGQLAQLTKPTTDHHSTVHQTNGNRHQAVGSLV